MIVAQSRRDRGPIVVQTWRSLRLILRKIRHKFGSYDSAQGNRSLDAANPRPHPHQLLTIFGLILPLKSHVLSSLFLTFDRLVKELSEFRGRSLVHRDPPAFRLNSEGIGAGLITNSSLISSNFPL